jgi:hypothetical protein
VGAVAYALKVTLVAIAVIAVAALRNVNKNHID